jgi:hypothetical protein
MRRTTDRGTPILKAELIQGKPTTHDEPTILTGEEALVPPQLGLVRGLLAVSALLLSVPTILLLFDGSLLGAVVAGGATGAYGVVLRATRRPDPAPALFAARLLSASALLLLFLGILLPSLL